MFWRIKAEPRVVVSAAVRSDPGLCRDRNEDSGRVILPTDSRLVARRGVLAVVADGMGGYQAGEVASRMAVDQIAQTYYGSARGDPGAALSKGFARANTAILSLARSRSELTGMGTTCTAVAITRAAAWMGHVGDSRLYLLRGGGIYQMSEDHSEVMQMVRNGVIPAEAARRREDRNVLLRALGTREEIEISTWSELAVRPGDRFLLCSDGLHGCLSSSQMYDAAIVRDAQTACDRLVELALMRGGPDNITAAIVAVDEAAEPVAPYPRATRAVEIPK